MFVRVLDFTMQRDIIRKIIFKKIEKLKDELRDTPYHKGTERHLGLLKAKVSRLKHDLGEREEKSSRGGIGYGVRRQGDASCGLIGPPSAGKSTLLNAITRAKSRVGSYQFTTLKTIPGMMIYRGARIQILDLPGLVVGAAGGKGGGRRVLSSARGVDLIILITDFERLSWLKKAKAELYQAGFRLDSNPPKVQIRKKIRGGIEVVDPFFSFDKETVVEIAQEFGLKNAQISFGEKIANIDGLIDAFSSNRVYLPSVEVINKADQFGIVQPVSGGVLVSAREKTGLDQLKREIWKKLGLIRVYLKKERKQPPDFKDPLILHQGDLIKDVAEKVSLDLLKKTKAALIWGPGAKFSGQKVSLKHPLSDGSIVWLVD